jgi:modification target Cys-rich repeat protein
MVRKIETIFVRARPRIRRTSAVALSVALGAIAGGCIDPESPLIERSAEGCDEFAVGEQVPQGLEVHAKVRAFMQAASDFGKNANEIKSSVMTACTKIATDLGAPDTWSAIDDPNDAITNAERTGACDAAGGRIEQVLIDAGKVNARVAIVVSRGECHLDFEMQKRCDAECALRASCDPGTIETRCEPAAVSVTCSGSCNAGAVCVGKAELAANCMGKCESECVGECHGTCIAEDGSVTTNNPQAKGKCESTCNGTCRGICKIEAASGIACGANVRCTGGCTGTVSDPVCTTTFKPPVCTVDEDCHAACSAKVAESATCDPTSVRIFAKIDATPDVKALVDTLEANLPDLLTAANHKGKLLLNASRRLGEAGDSLDSRIEDLDGKSLACLGKASTAVGQTIGSVDVSVNAAVDVTVRTTERAD